MKLNKIALGVALAAGAATVQAADTLFFPYVVSGGSVTTLVSVINTDSAGDATSGVQYYNNNGSSAAAYGGNNRYLHWRYHIKTGATNADTCLENDGYFPTSPLDMVTYDVSGTRGEGGVMFNDASVLNNWKAEGALNKLNAITLAGQRATLFVHNAAGATTDAPSLLGEALIVEFDTGSAWGYAAARQAAVRDSSTADNFDFSAIGPVNAPVSLLPQNEFTTRFFVTPVNQEEIRDEDNEVIIPASVMMAGDDGVDTVGFGAFSTVVDLAPVTGSIRVINRDESGISGGVTPQPVTCVGVVDVRHLVTAPNVWNYVGSEGGWARLVTTLPTGNANGRVFTQNAAVIKLDFRQAGANGALNMGAGVGAMNSAYAVNF